MVDRAGAFFQDEARFGIKSIDAAVACFARKGHEVELRIVIEQTEPQTVLAGRRAVAGHLFASRLVQGGQDLVFELDRVRDLGVLDLDLGSCVQGSPARLDRPFAVGQVDQVAAGLDGNDGWIVAGPGGLPGQARIELSAAMPVTIN